MATVLTLVPNLVPTPSRFVQDEGGPKFLSADDAANFQFRGGIGYVRSASARPTHGEALSRTFPNYATFTCRLRYICDFLYSRVPSLSPLKKKNKKNPNHMSCVPQRGSVVF